MHECRPKSIFTYSVNTFVF